MSMADEIARARSLVEATKRDGVTVNVDRLAGALESAISQLDDDFWFVSRDDHRVHVGHALYGFFEDSDAPEGIVIATWTDDGRVFYTPGTFSGEFSSIMAEALSRLAIVRDLRGEGVR